MKPNELLSVLQRAEKLKCTTRHCYSSSGRQESVAEHCWQMTLMAMLIEDELRKEFPEIDMYTVLRMCLIHDLGEAFTGDIPTFEKTTRDTETEEEQFLAWLHSFPEPERSQWIQLYRQMHELDTIEAKLYKALDKMEAVIQHNFSDLSTWLPLEYQLQLHYGKEEARVSQYTRELKTAVDEMTKEKVNKSEIRGKTTSKEKGKSIKNNKTNLNSSME